MVRDDAEVDGLIPGRLERCQQHRPITVVLSSGASATGRIVKFIAGRKHANTQSAHDRQFGGPGGSREAEIIVTQPAPAREDEGAASKVLTARSNVRSSRDAGQDVYLVAADLHVLLYDDGISAGRQRRARHDAHRFCRQELACEGMSGQRAARRHVASRARRSRSSAPRSRPSPRCRTTAQSSVAMTSAPSTRRSAALVGHCSSSLIGTMAGLSRARAVAASSSGPLTE